VFNIWIRNLIRVFMRHKMWLFHNKSYIRTVFQYTISQNKFTPLMKTGMHVEDRKMFCLNLANIPSQITSRVLMLSVDLNI